MSRDDGPSVAIVGGGPAGLIAAETLAVRGCRVTVFDRMPTFGRKFLMAGRGGLNVTNSEPIDPFVARYGEAAQYLRPHIDRFPPRALVRWAEGLGQQTFVGSSGRVFPRGLKASPLLRAWLVRLLDQGVRLVPRTDWLGWDDAGAPTFRDRPAIRPCATVLALGGATWPRLGSTGDWVPILAAKGVAVAPFRPANGGFVANWSEPFGSRFAGAPLKPLRLSFAGRSVRGEAIITRQGLEGGGVYALSAALRDAIERDGRAVLHLDLRPDTPGDRLAGKLARSRGSRSISNVLRKAAGLEPVAVNLVREANGGSLPNDLAHAIKNVAIVLTAPSDMQGAISAAGGVMWSEVNDDLMLNALPGVFVAGEMLDWEAPTGGYLLQACFATGMAAANGASAWLGLPPRAGPKTGHRA